LQRSELVKGYEVEKGKYVLLEDEEIKSVRLESTKTIDIERFVPASEIDRLYWDRPYFLAPDGKLAAEAFAVIRKAMEESGQIALGRVVLSQRERLMALEPRGKGILATALRSHDEVKNPASLFDDIPDVKVDKDMVQIAEKIIAQKADDFDPREFNDRYEDALRDLIARKMKGQKLVTAEEPEESNVIDLMTALKKSLAAKGGKETTAPAAKKSPASPPKKARAAAASAPRAKRVRAKP
jgi:DNA end-binding protein Ku